MGSEMCIRDSSLPAPYASLDTNRLSLAYFCVVGLDALGQLSSINAERVRRWVYSLQLVPPVDDHHLPPQRAGGFRGSAFLGAPHMPAGSPSTSEYDGAHLAMTYTALAVLLTLGDDLTGVDSERVLAFVASLQQDDGCFCAYLGGESDMRFLFCAAAVVTMLHGGSVPRDSAIDVEKATQYVLSSRCYDGGIGLGPGQESHGGSTCALGPMPHQDACASCACLAASRARWASFTSDLGRDCCSSLFAVRPQVHRTSGARLDGDPGPLAEARGNHWLVHGTTSRWLPGPSRQGRGHVLFILDWRVACPARSSEDDPR